MRNSTKGRFTDSLNSLKEPGIVWKQERDQLLSLNPDVKSLLKKKDDHDYQKLKNKKDSKYLQALSIQQEMKIKDRHTYKSFIKYPS